MPSSTRTDNPCTEVPIPTEQVYMFRQDTYGVILTGNTIPLPDGGILLEFRHIYLDTRHYLREEEFHKRFVPYALRE